MAATMALLVTLMMTGAAAASAASAEASTADAIERRPPAFFVFGDSLVDAGNNNYLPSLSRADIPPNGIDFRASNGWPTGRFTNGRTIPDIVGEMLGQPTYARPFLAPGTSGAAILDGVNYASGGSGILSGTGKVFVTRLGMDQQIDIFSKTRKQLDDLLGAAAAKRFMATKAVVSITTGSNDILNSYLLPFPISIGDRLAETPDKLIDSMITNMRSQLTRLYNLDARKFVVGNIGPLGCIPYQKTINRLNPGECVGLPNHLAQKYNAKLHSLLQDLNAQLPGAKFCLANVYDLTMEVVANYKQYGFKTASDACCGSGGQYAGITPCGAPGFFLCSNHSDYVFWDPYHPSEAANLIFAKHLVDGSTRYISPMNFRQLVAL